MPTYSELESVSEEGKFLLKNFQVAHKIDARILLNNASDIEFDLIINLLKFDPSKRLTIK